MAVATQERRRAGLDTGLAHESHFDRPWRIHDITADFRLEDVWELATPGGPDDFPLVLDVIRNLDLTGGRGSAATRALFAIRWKLGELFGWDRDDEGLGARVETLRDRLPDDLRSTPVDALATGGSPFTPLYVLDDEYAAEIANRTVHGVLHLGWVPDGDGTYHAQMAVLVKPNGRLGRAYVASIRPFRYLVVYPALRRSIARAWQARGPSPRP